VDRQTRHDLKSDKFVAEVAHTVSFLEEHKPAIIRYGSIALALIVLGVAFYYWNESRKETRRLALAAAMKTFNAVISEQSDPRVTSFRTQAERQAAIKKELGALIANHGGTEEAAIASYLLGVNAADQGELEESVKHLRDAANGGGKNYGPLAKLALADVYAAQGKTAEAEKLLREVIANPSVLASKSQATLNLARLLAKTKPAEAQKLLEPLRSESGAASRAALTLMAEIAEKK
jgi:predicted negative regulator of RcsB-dependent stress response